MRLFAKLSTVVVLVFIGVTSASAQTATFMEPGTSATQDLSFFLSSTGTVTSATDRLYSGPRALKTSTGAGNATATATTPAGVCSDAGCRISFRFNIDTLPATNDQIISPQNASSQGGMGAIRLLAAGTLQLNTGNGGTLATGTTVLAINTWYRIVYAYTLTNTTTFRMQVWINGALELDSANSGTLIRTGSSKFNIGISGGAGGGANRNAWFQDIYTDNGSSYGDPGNIYVTAKRPFANGTANGFTTQIGSGPAPNGVGSGHAPNVSEEPLSQSFGWSFLTALATVTEEYNIQNPSAGDLSVSLPGLKGVMGWVFASSAISETGKILVQNVTSNISLTSTPAFFFAIGSNTYPTGVGSDIGMQTDNSSTTTVSLYECGIVVAYVRTGNFFRLVR